METPTSPPSSVSELLAGSLCGAVERELRAQAIWKTGSLKAEHSRHVTEFLATDFQDAVFILHAPQCWSIQKGQLLSLIEQDKWPRGLLWSLKMQRRGCCLFFHGIYSWDGKSQCEGLPLAVCSISLCSRIGCAGCHGTQSALRHAAARLWCLCVNKKTPYPPGRLPRYCEW